MLSTGRTRKLQKNTKRNKINQCIHPGNLARKLRRSEVTLNHMRVNITHSKAIAFAQNQANNSHKQKHVVNASIFYSYLYFRRLHPLKLPKYITLTEYRLL
jgi:hypothetical protein